jgi:hypothetical protein
LAFRQDLGLGDSAVGAGAFASAAVDALVGVDLVSAFALGDGAHGANICAGTAGNAKFRVDNSGHNKISLNCCCVFQTAKIGIKFDFEKNCD